MRIAKSRIWDYVLYLLVSMVAVAGIFVPSVLNISPTEYKRWLALIVAILVILGFIVEDIKVLWGRKLYWVFISTSIGLNGIAFAVLALQKVQVSGVMLECVLFIEVCLVHVLKRWAVRERKTRTF